jgi:hypothetical protein
MAQEGPNMSYKFQSRQKEQLKSVLEDNSRLNDELLSIIRRNRGEAPQEYQVAEDHRTVEQFYSKHSHRKRPDDEDRTAFLTSVKRDTVMTFGDKNRSVKGSERKNSEESLASLRGNQWPRAEEHVESEDHKQRDLKDALEYMKKREKALQEEVKALNQTILK